MIETLSFCPTCYKKIPANIHFRNDGVWMNKTCDKHGDFEFQVEKDLRHVSSFYNIGTMGANNIISIPIHNQCNMQCPWCYYPMGIEEMHPFRFYDRMLLPYKGTHALLFVGGEPTERPDYFDFVSDANKRGWNTYTMTNMLNLSDEVFFNNTISENFINKNLMAYKFSFSMQHPKNYDESIYIKKMSVIEKLLSLGIKANCVQFSIQTLDELDFIRDFYNQTKHAYTHIRIRTMYGNWKDKGDQNKIWLSDLHKAFLDKFCDLNPAISQTPEISNLYSIYMLMDDYKQVSLSSAPTVENIDIRVADRPGLVYSMDNKCHPFPISQIVNEGISKGWYNGFEITGDKQ